ncbi:predicted protein [Chaetoceros tenuissimus]|uniref:Uncharacterized protein n=1 Tax=Chaetoceros tenuissimus TaxID=426638 RepID=A0AAD3H869_9STRA|nr:predicted protein [Chaetoceros tenuissimus]
MGKSSKSKGKKLAKQERAMHLKKVEVWKKTMCRIDTEVHDSLGDLFTNGRKRERIRLLEDQLQLTLNTEEAFAFINRYQSYKTELSTVCSALLLEQLLLSNYIQASNSFNEMMNYPLTDEFGCLIKQFSNLLLLWIEGENVDRKDAIAKVTEYAFKVIHRHDHINLFWILLLERTFTVLIRQPITEKHFEKVELLSLAMLRNDGKGEFKNAWTKVAQTFLVYSYIDKVRFYFLGGQKQVQIQAILEKVRNMRPVFNQLSLGTWSFAYSLLDSYTFMCKKDEYSTEEARYITNKFIEPLEKYIASRSRYAQKLFTHAATRIL